MREIVWSARAIDQYAIAFEFLAERNPSAADKLRVRVRETLDILVRRPIGRLGYADNTFEKIVQQTSYVIVFEVAGDELRILRLFHMSQDWRDWRDAEVEAQ